MICHFRQILVFLFLLNLGPLVGQDSLFMMSWHSVYDDELHEWEVFYENPDGEVEVGEIEAIWHQSDDWSTWEVNIGDHYGQIRQKWNDNDQLWEFRMHNNITTAETKWNNDYSEWTIRYNDNEKIRWLSKSYETGNQWYFSDKIFGYYSFTTENWNDPRDWKIVDRTLIDLPIDVKIMCSFIALYRTTRKFRQ